ncbi:unknown [Clostridium sp. CAG:798]|nr:unknown [Clostridium sp. CAG:798]
MNSEYEELENILRELEELEKAKEYIDKLNSKIKTIHKDNKFVGKKLNMLTVLEKSDKRAKNRKYII